MLHVIDVEKKSWANALGAQNAELRFVLHVLKQRIWKFAIYVVGRLKIYYNIVF
jgi:hypothetical protein